MKKIKKYILNIFCLLTVGNVFPQSHEIDSLRNFIAKSKSDTLKVKALLSLGSLQIKNPDSLVRKSIAENYKEALKISDKLNYKYGQIFSLCALGAWEEEVHSDFKTALSYYYKATAIAEDYGKDPITFEKYGQILNACFYLGDYPKAMETAVKGLKLAEKTNNRNMIANYYNLFGFIYSNQNNYIKTKEYLEKYLALAQEIGNQSMLAHAYGGMADVTEREKKYELSLDYLFKALSIYFKMDAASTEINKKAFAKQQITSMYNGIASLYKSLGKNDLALDYSLKCVALAEQVGVNRYELANYYITNGGLFINVKNFQKAEEAILKGLTIANEIRHRENIKMAYYQLSQLYSAKNDFKKAFEYHTKYAELKDTLLNEQNSKQMTEMNTKYESEKKDKELIKKDAEINEQQLEAKQQSTLRNAFITGFVLVLLLALFIFRSYRHKQKANIAISKQKEIIEDKNKEITDSIHYAKRIQKALLASENLLQKNLPEHFVLYKPKDIVSGDFYWAHSVQEKFLLCVADCTGHGVPGAFMSLLNISFLNEITIEKKVTEPDMILNNVRSSIINALNTEGNEESKDGMDCVMCSFDFKKNTLEYSAANNSFYIIKNNSLVTSLADKMPVGKSPKENDTFKKHTIGFEKNDVIYILTDGYPDQFGGQKGKKFKYKQLEDLLMTNHQKSMDEQKKILDQTIKSWKGPLEQVDDILIIGIRV